METQKLGLTHTQAKVLGAIRELTAKGDGIGPSFREIQKLTGIKSLSNVHLVVRNPGHINFAPKGKRSISLVQ